MKRISVLFSIIILGSLHLFSQNVTIPDVAFFYALIARGVDTNEDREISYSEAEAVTSLIIRNELISNLMGIEAFVNIEELDCGYNQLTSLNVSKNLALIKLDCSYNPITNLDLTENIAIKYLRCTNLHFFQDRDGALTSLKIPNNSKLKYLNCSGQLLTELDVSGCEALERLFCNKNQLNSLDFNGTINLRVLFCGGNQISSLNLSNNNFLDSLDCGAFSFYVLGGWIKGTGNPLTQLDVTNYINLTYLNCHNTNLTELDVSKNLKLRKLHCGNSFGDTLFLNKLSVLDVSNNTVLNELNCSSNQLTSLDVSNNTVLSQLDISRNQSLYEVCVWETFTTDSDNIYTDSTNSPNVNFTTDCTFGIEETNHHKLSIYPNPTNSLLTIETDQPDCYSIDIHSLNGQLIYKEEMEGNLKQIDLTSFSKGIYFITVRSDAWVRTEKVMKL